MVACHVRPGCLRLVAGTSVAWNQGCGHLSLRQTDRAPQSASACRFGRVSELPSEHPPGVGDCDSGSARTCEGCGIGHEPSQAYGRIREARVQGEGCTTCHAAVVHERPIKGYPIVIPRGHVSADSRPWKPEHPEGSVLHKRARRIASAATIINRV